MGDDEETMGGWGRVGVGGAARAESGHLKKVRATAPMLLKFKMVGYEDLKVHLWHQNGWKSIASN